MYDSFYSKNMIYDAFQLLNLYIKNYEVQHRTYIKHYIYHYKEQIQYGKETYSINFTNYKKLKIIQIIPISDFTYNYIPKKSMLKKYKINSIFWALKNAIPGYRGNPLDLLANFLNWCHTLKLDTRTKSYVRLKFLHVRSHSR